MNRQECLFPQEPSWPGILCITARHRNKQDEREEQHAIKIRTEQQQSFAFSQREVEFRFNFTGKESRVISRGVREQGVCQQISVKQVKVCFHQIYLQPFTFAEHGFGTQREFIPQIDRGQQPSADQSQ